MKKCTSEIECLKFPASKEDCDSCMSYKDTDESKLLKNHFKETLGGYLHKELGEDSPFNSPSQNLKIMENSKERILTREECLSLDVETYNAAMQLEWKRGKAGKNLSGELSTCKHCGRKYAICCICDEAEHRWEEMIKEVREVSEMNNKSDEDES